MRPATWTCALGFLALSTAVEASNVRGVNVAHHESLSRLEIAEVRAVSTGRPEASRETRMTFDALGRTFDLRLRPNTSLLVGEARRSVRDDVEIYRGNIAGNESSWVRLVVADGVPRGVIWDGSEMFAVEAPGDSLLSVTEPVIYSMSNVTVAPGVMSCGVGLTPANGSRVLQALAAELQVAAQQAPGASEEMLIGAVADFEFTSQFAQASEAETAMVTRLNTVDGIFSEQLAVQLTVDVIDTFDDANDPFSDTTVAGDLLDEVADFRVGDAQQRQTGVTHLYTSRNLDGQTAGVAFVSAVCSTNFGAGLTQGTFGPMLDALISAHEIGHNFNASHDGDPDGSCPAEPDDMFLMAPSVNPNNDMFGPCSLDVMRARAAAASCVNPLPVVDMTIINDGQPASILLGTTTDVVFDVTNLGSQDASGVTAEVTLPNNLGFVSASASQGNCTNGAGVVSCTIGAVSGNTGGTVTVTVTGNTVGPATISASASADVDENANNNQTVLQSNVDPAVNLVVGSAGSPSIALNQSATLTAGLSNTSSLDASSVAVNVTLAAGLRADSADLPGGTCTVAPQQVDCTLATLASQATSNLSIDVTGLAAGSQTYTVTASSAETEAQPGNNSSGGTVTVTTNSGGSTGGGNSGGDDGGSGGSGPLLLWLTLCGLLGRRALYRTT